MSTPGKGTHTSVNGHPPIVQWTVNSSSGRKSEKPSTRGFPGGTSGKESTYKCRRRKRHVFVPWVWKISWRRAWQPTPVFLPGKSHGHRSLVDYSPWGHKESDTTEVTENTHIYVRVCIYIYICITELIYYIYIIYQFSSVSQSCPTLCDPMDCSTPSFPVHHQLPELAQTHVH